MGGNRWESRMKGKSSMGKKYEKQIQELLDQMTLEEKAGQLQQCGPSLVGAFEVSFEELLDMMFDGRISKEEFDRLMSTTEQDYHEEDLRAGKVGSYNGIDAAATANRLQKIAVEETRLGIPLLFGYDVIHGFRTVTPIPLAESCAWDKKLWEATGRLAAQEATAAGIHMSFAPMVDVAKDARWGRVSEGAGEDVLLNGDYGVAKVRGFQGEDLTKADAMIACVKHFAAYGAGEAGRDYNRVDMSPQRLWDEYLPSYKACIDAGARALMPAFNDINGVPCSANRWLLRNVLREGWGFDGMTVSDANAIAECVEHGIAADKKEAARKCLEAGVDMDMTSNSYIESVCGLVKEGKLAEKVLDASVANILRLKFELGLFEHPYKTSEEREQTAYLTEEARALARKAAVKSIVLLKNEHILPLSKGQKLGIFGKLADDRGEMTGAWSIGAHPEDCRSIVDACRMSGASYQYCGGEEDFSEVAAWSDVLIAAIGERKEESGEAASRADITLSRQDMTLVEKLLGTGKPVVAVLFNGRPLALSWLDKAVPAIVEAWHLGVEAGTAILDILFGDENPSGKLTATFPHQTGQCPMYYAHMNTGRPGGKSKFTSKYLDAPTQPLYPFGYGLSYTSFAYSDLTVERQNDGFQVCVSVSNTGARDGEEIVQCYVQDVVASRARPVKELKAYTKMDLKAGETKKVEFVIPFEKLGFYNMDMQYVVEPGAFKIYVGGNSRDTCEKTVVLSC